MVWDNYSPRDFKVVTIPERLMDAMDVYTSKTGMRKTSIFDAAIFKLMRIWDEGKRDEVERALFYNPPPQSLKNVPLCIRFTGEESFQWVCDLEQNEAIVASTRDFVLRLLSWFLRENGVLEKHDEKVFLKGKK